MLPIGLLVPVVLVGWGTACALTCWRWAGALARVPALVTNELPFAAAYLLLASIALALAQGDLDSAAGAAVGVAAAVVLVGLAVIVRRALRADRALGNPAPPSRPWTRILRAPLPALRGDVTRMRNLAYGEGPRHTLDVYCRRDRPAGVPVVVHFHGGGFSSGNKNREARPLIGHLVEQRGGVHQRELSAATARESRRSGRRCPSRDRVGAIACEASTAVIRRDSSWSASSAGAYLAIEAVNDGAVGIAGLICRYGYYGDLAPTRDLPPMLVIHGENDLLVRAAAVREFVERMRAGSAALVEYAELPGAHHDFDLLLKDRRLSRLLR